MEKAFDVTIFKWCWHDSNKNVPFMKLRLCDRFMVLYSVWKWSCTRIEMVWWRTEMECLLFCTNCEVRTWKSSIALNQRYVKTNSPTSAERWCIMLRKEVLKRELVREKEQRVRGLNKGGGCGGGMPSSTCQSVGSNFPSPWSTFIWKLLLARSRLISRKMNTVMEICDSIPSEGIGQLWITSKHAKERAWHFRKKVLYCGFE